MSLFHGGHVPDSTPVLDVIAPSISAEQNVTLTRPFCREEVVATLKQMGKRKAPGADGMSVLFYRLYWHIIGDDVVGTVLNILDLGIMPEQLNHTLIALIPKVKNPESPKEFRPISLCNVLYKLVAKVLANRLKEVLDSVVTEEQSAFVPRRFITDNVMAAFECFQLMKKIGKSSKGGYFGAKIDMAKAYDRVEWWFLEGIMQKMGFADQWI
ncbi:unnamed protein product [Linum trigynum]|uniref:Reverse transcriptase domain-containing protein n=1 Tax=Linum trigynum TaxID=586398 RepID=A0AAV2GG12_9ROSI